jgi:hypothetical protein
MLSQCVSLCPPTNISHPLMVPVDQLKILQWWANVSAFVLRSTQQFSPHAAHRSDYNPPMLSQSFRLYFMASTQQFLTPWCLFGTDPDRNRVLEKPPAVNRFPAVESHLGRTRLLRDPTQTQVWSEQVWLNTTFISQGSRSWDILAVET